MKYFPIRSALAFALFLFCSNQIWAQTSQDTTPYDLAWEHAIGQNFSGIVLLAEQGEIVFQRAHGFADAKRQLPLGPESPMGVASITKSFTAVLIMQLVEQGRLRLDQSLAELLPAYSVPKAKKILVKDLLMHTSGLPGEADAVYRTPLSAQEVLNRVLTKDARYSKPGRFHYNNMDFLLLGEIITKLTGESWEQRVQSQILSPLGMKQTGFRRSDMAPGKIATGFMQDDKGALHPEPTFAIENFGAAGSMYATAADILRYDQALHQNVLLSPESRARLFESHPKLGYVAFGHWAYNYPFLPSRPYLVERRGGILGFQAVWVRFEEEQKTLIILSNADTFDPDSFGDATNLKDILIRIMGKESSADEG